jgi:stage V sporulation protein AE
LQKFLQSHTFWQEKIPLSPCGDCPPFAKEGCPLNRNLYSRAPPKFMIFLYSFLFGGLLCAIAQLLIDFTKMTPARILVLYVTLGVILTFLGLYNPLTDKFGMGAGVPLLGFGNLLANGVIKSIGQKGVMGILTGGLAAASAGLSAAIFFGYLFALVFTPKEK